MSAHITERRDVVCVLRRALKEDVIVLEVVIHHILSHSQGRLAVAHGHWFESLLCDGEELGFLRMWCWGIVVPFMRASNPRKVGP